MAISTCIKCDNKKFEFKTGSLMNPNNLQVVKVYFIRCASCGGVISAQTNDPLPAVNEGEEEHL